MRNGGSGLELLLFSDDVMIGVIMGEVIEGDDDAVEKSCIPAPVALVVKICMPELTAAATAACSEDSIR